MDKIQELISKLKGNPKAEAKTVKKLFDKLDGETNGTISIDVPTKFAPLFELFAEGPEKVEAAFTNKKGPEMFVKGKISLKDFLNAAHKEGDKKTVKVNMSKLKNAIVDGLDKNAKDVSLNESASLLTEAIDPFSMAFQMTFIKIWAGMAVCILACALYIFIITIWAIAAGEVGPNGEKDIGRLYLGNPLIWAITMHIKLVKKGKAAKLAKKNEGVEDGDDSILTGLPMTEFATGEEALTAVDGNDQELLNAYRLVLSDLKHRSPNGAVPDPLKEGDESEPGSKGETLQEEADSGDDSIFSSMTESSDDTDKESQKDKK